MALGEVVALSNNTFLPLFEHVENSRNKVFRGDTTKQQALDDIRATLTALEDVFTKFRTLYLLLEGAQQRCI